MLVRLKKDRNIFPYKDFLISPIIYHFSYFLDEDKQTFASQLLAANSKIEDQNKALRSVVNIRTYYDTLQTTNFLVVRVLSGISNCAWKLVWGQDIHLNSSYWTPNLR